MEEIELLDVADDLLIINKTTIDRLFLEEKQHALILYLFYYKTAKWQKHNPIKANDDYCKRCLHWGTDKLKETKQRLKEMELIAVEKRFDEQHKLEGWYVRVNYLIDNSTIPKTTIPTKPQVDIQETNTNNNNNINTNNNKNTNKEIYKEKRFKKPTLEEVKAYCLERNNNVDAETFYDYFETGGWVDSKGNKVKNWKQKIITWEKNTKTNKEDERQKRIEEWLKSE